MDHLQLAQDLIPRFTVNVNNQGGSANVLVVPLSHGGDQHIPQHVITEQVRHYSDLKHVKIILKLLSVCNLCCQIPALPNDDITTRSALQHPPNVNSDLYQTNQVHKTLVLRCTIITDNHLFLSLSLSLSWGPDQPSMPFSWTVQTRVWPIFSQKILKTKKTALTSEQC